jgi:hypothetical protein
MSKYLLVLLGVLVACSTTPTTTTGLTATTSQSSPTTLAPVPMSSEEAATAFFDAWLADDQNAMEALSRPEVLAEAEAVADLRDQPWSFDHCEGAAGTLYCTWTTGFDQLVVAVVNIEEPHLVTSFRPFDQ